MARMDDGGRRPPRSVPTPPRAPKKPVAKKKKTKAAAPPAPKYGFQEMVAALPEWAQNLMSDSEIATIARLTLEQNWDANRVRAAIIGTKWYRTHNLQQRRWVTLTPADQQAEVRKVKDDITKLARQGYWIRLDEPGADAWARRVASGDLLQEDLDLEFRNQAKRLYPKFAPQIDQGVHPDLLFRPYLTTAAEELEVAPDAIVGDDRIFGEVMRGGVTDKFPSHTDFLKSIRSLPEWKNTRKAETLVNDWAARVIGGVFQEM